MSASVNLLDKERFHTAVLQERKISKDRFETNTNVLFGNYHSYSWMLSAPTNASLYQRVLLDAYLNQVTAPPHVAFSKHDVVTTNFDAFVSANIGTAAQLAVVELRQISGLTNEEIAPLAGVSRRSLQNWLAGGVISARREQRLRTLVEAIRSLSDKDPAVTRRRLLDRDIGCMRPYDLIVEGRFDVAVDLALGRRPNIAATNPQPKYDLVAQLNRVESRIDLPEGRLNRRLSGRLRR